MWCYCQSRYGFCEDDDDDDGDDDNTGDTRSEQTTRGDSSVYASILSDSSHPLAEPADTAEERIMPHGPRVLLSGLTTKVRQTKAYLQPSSNYDEFRDSAVFHRLCSMSERREEVPSPARTMSLAWNQGSRWTCIGFRLGTIVSVPCAI